MNPILRRAVPFLVAAAVLAILVVVLGVVAPWNDPTADDSIGTGPMPLDSATSVPAGGGSSGSSGTGSPPPAPSTGPGPDDPQSRFTAVQLGDDGASLDVTFWGGVDTCFRYTVQADEDAQVVSLSLAEERRGDGPCIELAQEHQRTVALEQPLGDRQVRDAATGAVLDPQ